MHHEPLLCLHPFQIEDVGAWSDERHEAHHQLFADGVDGRIRHLREVLLEIGVQ